MSNINDKFIIDNSSIPSVNEESGLVIQDDIVIKDKSTNEILNKKHIAGRKNNGKS